MRLSSLQTFQTGVSQIVDLTALVNSTQEQISRGTRILTASDDPVAYSQIQDLNREASLREQFQSNITLLENSLELEDSTLGSINDAVLRIRELVLQANNGTLVESDREAIATELTVLRDELASLMNTRDASGEYIFSGYKGSVQPFSSNGSGNYTFNGDEGQRRLQIGTSTYIAASDSGKDIFVNVASAEATFRTGVNPNNRAVPPAQITAGFVYDQEAYNATFPESYTIEFQNPTDLQLLDPAAAAVPNYNIIRKSDGRVMESNVLYQSGTAIQYSGMQFTVSGSPSVGDSFTLQATDNQDLLTTISRAIEGLQTLGLDSDDQTAYTGLMATTIENLDNAQTRVLEFRAQVGARLNTVESTQELHEELDIISAQLLSSLQDLDYAEAVSQLTFETFVLESAQQTYVRISGLSLFNSL